MSTKNDAQGLTAVGDGGPNRRSTSSSPERRFSGVRNPVCAANGLRREASVGPTGVAFVVRSCVQPQMPSARRTATSWPT